MKIEAEKVVSIHYTLTLESGELIDTTDGEEPLRYLAGSGQIIPGLERELMGKNIGDSINVSVAPADAYGEFDEELVQSLPREMFTGIENIEVGMEFQTQNEEGDAQYVVVVGVEEDEIKIDGNHEFAGKTLVFDVKVDGVREATPEELENGHA